MTANRPPGCTLGGIVTAYVIERCPVEPPFAPLPFTPDLFAEALLALSLKELVAERAACVLLLAFAWAEPMAPLPAPVVVVLLRVLG